MEIEAKFVVSDAGTLERLKRVARLGEFTLLGGQVKQIHDVYLDTARRKILAAGYALRKREQSGGLLFTLKGLSRPDGAVHHREELEVSLPSDQPPESWPASPIRERVLKLIGEEPLIALFDLDQRRIVRPVHWEGHLVAELSLDQVHMANSDREEAYYELEAELLAEDDESALAQLVAILQQEWKLEPEPLSKFERAMRFFAPDFPSNGLLSPQERTICLQIAARGDHFRRRALGLLALDEGATQEVAGARAGLSARRVRYWLADFRKVRLNIFPARVRLEARAELDVEIQPCVGDAKAEEHDVVPESGVTEREADGLSVEPPVTLPTEPGLKAGDAMSEAARKTLQFHLQRMLYHEARLRLDEDIEDLHRMRVATRRMRMAIRVFAEYLDRKRFRSYAKELRRTGQALGAVRDLDVFRDKIRRYLKTLSPAKRPSLDPLLEVLQIQREEARERLWAYLGGERYLAFKSEFAESLEALGIDASPALSRRGEPIPYRVRDVVPIIIHGKVATERAYQEWITGTDTPLKRYHQLRIATKGLRYTLEYFQEVLGPDASMLIDKVTDLQDHLGTLQDAIVACNLLRDFLTWGTWGHPQRKGASWPTEPVVAPGVAIYMAARQAELQRQIDTFPQAWEEVQSREFSQLVESALSALW